MPRLRTLVLALPVVELVLLIVLGTQIGGLETLLYVIGTFVIGFALLRFAGRARPPVPRGMGHPAMAFVGGGPTAASGALLMIPGVLSDLLGVLLLIPGFRRLLAAGGRKFLERRLAQAGFGPGPIGSASPFGSMGAPGSGDTGPVVVEAEVVDERPND